MFRIAVPILVVALAAAFLFGFSPTQTSTEIILPGTDYETAAYIYKSSKPGPAVLILGGVHGNEIAGSRAAEALRELDVVRGTMIIVPRVNTRALDAGVRTLPAIGDVNRAYPGSAAGTPAERLADAIVSLMTRHQVSMVIDLHEARNFNRIDPTSLGQTIEFADNDKSAMLALAAVEYINRSIRDQEAQFTFLANPIKGSGAYYAGRLGLTAFTLETCVKQPLEDRVFQHFELARFMLKEAGIIR